MIEAQVNQKKGLSQAFHFFTSGILDIRFKQKITIELLPFFYTLLLFASLVVSIVLIATAFWISIQVGLFSLVIVPIGFVVAVAIIRAALEYLVMAYRILEIVNNMNRIPSQVDNLNDQVNYISGELSHIIENVDNMSNTLVNVNKTLTLLNPPLALLSLPQRLARKIR